MGLKSVHVKCTWSVVTSTLKMFFNLALAGNQPSFYHRLLPALICLTGFMIQVIEVSRLYFRYSTQTEVGVFVADELEPPSLSVCFRYIDILNRTRLSQELKIHVKSPIRVTEDIHYIQSLLRIKDIFEFSPRLEDIYESCIIRFPNEYQVHKLTKDKCRENFKMHRYYHREFICYRFEPKNFNQRLQIKYYSYAPEYFNLVFSIHFDSRIFSDSEYFSAYVHEPNTSFLLDSGQSKMFLRIYKRMNRARETISVSYSSVRTERMPPPYDTRCINPNFINSASQMSKLFIEFDCINNFTLRELDRVMFALHTYKSNLTAKVLTVPDLTNPYIGNKLRRYTRMCKVKNDPCITSFTFSKVSLYPSEVLSSELLVPSDPIINIRHVPRMIAVEFLVYLSSSFGTWFGISIFTFLSLSSYTGLALYTKIYQSKRARVTKRRVRPKFKSTDGQSECIWPVEETLAVKHAYGQWKQTRPRVERI